MKLTDLVNNRKTVAKILITEMQLKRICSLLIDDNKIKHEKKQFKKK